MSTVTTELPEGMNPLQFILLNCVRLPILLHPEQAAALLNLRDHQLSIIVAAGILKPLGRKKKQNCQNWFSAHEVMKLAPDVAPQRRMSRPCIGIGKKRTKREKRSSSSNVLNVKRIRMTSVAIDFRAEVSPNHI
jgi:hypothetical protein